MLFSITFTPIKGNGEHTEETVEFWNKWAKDHPSVDIQASTRNGQGTVTYLSLPELGASRALEIVGSCWGREYNAQAWMNAKPLAQALYERVLDLSVASGEAIWLLKRTRSSSNKLWQRDVAKARQLLEKTLHAE